MVQSDGQDDHVPRARFTRGETQPALMTVSPTLFLVVLGGRTAGSHIEQHDVRWVVGGRIEDTIPALKEQWFGLLTGLHIDSYKAIRHVDGYAIELIQAQQAPLQSDYRHSSACNDQLWFINLGGYNSESPQELHQFGLVVAPNQQAAKASARRRWLKGALQVHKDDLHNINQFKSVDDCLPIFRAEGWQIVLKPEPNKTDSGLKPDWFGYWRIDGRVPKPRPD